MELWQLKCFSAVAVSLNFSRAAESLFVSQSALSQQIQSLEQELGTSLFFRSKHAVVLTPAGLALQQHVPIIVEAVKQAENAVVLAIAEESPMVQITLGIEEGFSDCDAVQSRLSELIVDVQQKNPRLQVRIKETTYGKMEHALIKGDIDLGFALMPRYNSALIKFHSKKITAMPIFQDNLQLILANHLLDGNTEQDICAILKKHPVLVPKSDERILTHVLKIMSAMQIAPQIEYVETKLESRLVAEAGKGLLLGPVNTVRISMNHMECVPLLVPEAQMEYCVLYNNENDKSIIQELIVGMIEPS